MTEDTFFDDIKAGVTLLSLGETVSLDMSGGRERILARLLIDRLVLTALPCAGAAFAQLVESSRIGTSAVPSLFQPWPVPALDAAGAVGLINTFQERPDALGVVEALIADAALRRLPRNTPELGSRFCSDP